MADWTDDKLFKNALVWYIALKKSGKRVCVGYKSERLNPFLFMAMKRRRMELLQAILACVIPTRTRDVWVRTRSFAWFTMAEEQFSDEQWYDNFRVTKATFAFILNEVSQDISRQDTTMRRAIPAKHRLALTLYFLASTAENRTIGNLFGVSSAFVCLCVREVCQAIANRLSKVINFPQGDNLLHVIQGYEEEWGFPMCAGAIDGTHIPILAPKESHVDYVNRKGYHSIIMQAVVDCNYLFRDVVVGWPGSVHDARVFGNSAFFKKANNRGLFCGVKSKNICGQEISPLILGDPAYPLLPWLMKPYPESSQSPGAEVFNHQLSRTRMTVENTFGRWKGRFIRFSKRVDMEVCNTVTTVIASCILHNICEGQKNAFLPEWEQAPLQQTAEQGNTTTLEEDAEDIRGALAQYFLTKV